MNPGAAERAAPGAAAPAPIYYTRCPIAGATGIALARGMLAGAYAGSGYQPRDIADLGAGQADVHYTHRLDRCFREGGAGPPLWARARGAATRLVGIAFIEETLGIFVRAEDPAGSVAELAGRRIGLPRWPSLPVDFWRFAAEKGFHSALSRHGMTRGDVRAIDVVETDDAPAAPARGAGAGGRRANRYRGQLAALLDGTIDALFAKGVEIGPLERDGGGRIRMLFDVAASPVLEDRVNNSTPRLVTVGSRLAADEPDAVVRYLCALLRAARWAPGHAAEARAIAARECGVAEDAIDRYLAADWRERLAPRIDADLLDSVGVLESFLAERGYLAGDFDLAAWIDPEPLAQALEREAAGAGDQIF